jgi:uncharacterized membrane protein required for colicin V production
MIIDISKLNYIDYLVFTIIIISMVIGFFRGFIQSFLGFFAWIFALALMFIFQPDVYHLLEKHVSSKILLYSFSYFGTFLLFLVIISYINSKITNLFASIKGGVIDLSLGAAFGVVRGCFINCILFFLIIWLSHSVDTKPHAITHAQSYRLLKLGTNYMIDNIVKYAGHQPTEEFLIDTQKKIFNLDTEDEELKELLVDKVDSLTNKTNDPEDEDNSSHIKSETTEPKEHNQLTDEDI